MNTAAEMVKMTIGDLIFQNAALQAKVAELEAELKALKEANEKAVNPVRDG